MDETKDKKSLEEEIRDLLKDMGVKKHDKQTVAMLCERANAYIANILFDAKDYSVHSGRSAIQVSDLRLAVQQKQANLVNFLPRPEEIFELAERINSMPLPVIPDYYGARIPNLEHCLLGPKIEVMPWSDLNENNKRNLNEMEKSDEIKRKRIYSKASNQMLIKISSLGNSNPSNFN
eukprot:CAMPEP_0171464886 /NCGR_PEP_ID=MMETSP0945-20130129/8082_1 /TAXON_ID=109269 /ORGANISM="Vaucheria litorea, Strain CCMP2940" /LENGTH=176 /DNA_ID=CAMNT_0011992177 /DNA_START=58 /DNA_END=588 /DNA_ORIENTATION=+